MIARRIIVRGRVQGVFYRGWTLETARGLGITGWVRNLAGGEVELFAMGTEDRLRELIERLHEGPAAARVEAVDVSEAAPEPLAGFEQRPTA